MRAPASIIFDRRGDHVTGHVASPALNPSLIGPCIGCAAEVAAAWMDLLNSPDGIVVDVASLPVALRVPAEDSGFVTLWVWPSRHDSHLSSVAWAIAWRNEPHLDIDQTRRQMMARLANLAGLIVDRAREDAAAKYAASHEALTGLLNRVEFSNRLNATISDGGGLTVLYLDLDGFKPINDRFGHGAGDVVLAEVARRTVRAVPAGAVVARLGGDEFSVLYVDDGDVDTGADAVAGSISSVLAEPIELGTQHVRVGASIGIARHGVDGITADELIDAADRALLLRMKRTRQGERRRY
jgi:diguanylate cyclase (GGDEF)-like protein